MLTGKITASEKRAAVVKKYDEILGRNKYSQAKRSYAFKKYSDGKYYSDCSSSVALAYKYAGYPFYDNNGSYNPNTVGMYQAKSLEDVPVVIKNGIIQNPEVLRQGDMLLFAGTDSSRKYAGYVGHVEMVAKIDGKKVTLYGHGSGTPRATEMNAYCKSRYNKKASTALGHRGLIKVRRFITDDAIESAPAPETDNCLELKAGTWNLRTGPGTNYASAGTVKNGDAIYKVDSGEWTPVHRKNEKSVLWIGPSALKK